MDTTLIKERNYRMVEMLRHQNDREQRRLEARLYESGGLEANHRYALDNMSREQQIIKKELSSLRQTTTTSWGILPPRPGEEPQEPPGQPPSPMRTDPRKRRRGGTKRKARRRSLEEQKLAAKQAQDEAVRKFREDVEREGWTEENNNNNADKDNKEDKDKPTDQESDSDAGAASSKTRSTEQARTDTSSNHHQSTSAVPHLPHLLQTAIQEEEDAVDIPTSTSRSTPASTTPSGTAADVVALGDINVHEAKDSVAKRLGSGSGTGSEKQNHHPKEQPNNTAFSPQDKRLPLSLSPVREAEAEEEQPGRVSVASKKSPKKVPLSKVKTKGTNDKLETAFDMLRYNPDGSLRTVHTLPDFQTSLREAMKARYLRMKGSQWVEKELSNSEIFGKKRTKTADKPRSAKSK